MIESWHNFCIASCWIHKDRRILLSHILSYRQRLESARRSVSVRLQTWIVTDDQWTNDQIRCFCFLMSTIVPVEMKQSGLELLPSCRAQHVEWRWVEQVERWCISLCSFPMSSHVSPTPRRSLRNLIIPTLSDSLLSTRTTGKGY